MLLSFAILATGGWFFLRDGREPAATIPTLAATANMRDGVHAQVQTQVPTQTPTPAAVATTTPTATKVPPTATRPVPTATRPTATATATTITATAILTPTVAITPTPTLRPPPPLHLTPGDPRPYLDTFRLVTFYGSPPGAALGVLGAAPREAITERLRAVAAQYQELSPDRYVMPAYHMVVTIADPAPGRDGDYNHRMDADVLDDWIAAAAAEGVAVILDVQPGYGDVLAEVDFLRPYLRQPHVHLALDSEFTMDGGAIPGASLGRLFPHHINPVQAVLEEIALEIGMKKVLIIHQFDGVMVVDKEGIVDYPNVELVFDADGFGGPEGKRSDYLQYAGEPGFEYGGFKLFYDWDWPLMAPADVMSLEPRPAVIVYQ